MKKRSQLLLFAAFILTLIVTVNLAATDTSAYSKTKKSNTYDCIKSGNTVYCRDAAKVFKVNLTTRKVTLLKTIESSPMIKKGKYLYFTTEAGFMQYRIYRLNTKTGKGKYLTKAMEIGGFSVKGKYIYYQYNTASGKTKYMKMRLNGKGKHKTSCRPAGKYKPANVNGYSINWPGGSNYSIPYNYYLKTPKGNILLETVSTGPYIG